MCTQVCVSGLDFFASPLTSEKPSDLLLSLWGPCGPVARLSPVRYKPGTFWAFPDLALCNADEETALYTVGKLRLRDTEQATSSGLEVRAWDCKQAHPPWGTLIPSIQAARGALVPGPLGASPFRPLHTLPKPKSAPERHNVDSPQPLVTDTKTRTPKRGQEGAPGQLGQDAG